MKKILAIFAFIMSLGFSFAADTDHFVVQVKPDSVTINESIDIIIKAVDDKGTVNKSFTSDGVMIEIEGGDKDSYTLSNDYVEFAQEDQGQKTVSKGLLFNKAGTYKIKVSDVVETNLVGEASLNVKGEGTETKSEITVSSPSDGSEVSSSFDVVAATKSGNSGYEVYIDDEKKAEDLTDENGDITTKLDGLDTGEHELVIKLVDVEGKVVSESDKVKFKVKGDDNQIFKSIEFTPSNVANVGDKVIVLVKTSSSVTSAELKIEGLGSFPMEKTGEGEFSKEVSSDKKGDFVVNLGLTVNGSSQDMPKVGTLSIKQGAAIKEVKYIKPSKTEINLDWTYEGDAKFFKVQYGTSKDKMDKTLIVNTNKASLTGLTEIDTYFAQIYPLNDKQEVAGTESTLLVIEPAMQGAASCKIAGIKWKTIKEGDKYFLVWDNVEGAVKYNIYKSDIETKDMKTMQKVGDTTALRFEFPFDPKAKKDTYAYYAVEAECQDGNKAQVDNIKKVKVGPLDTLFFVMMLSVLVYLGFKLYNYSR